ncbi:hypothetical protein KKH3_16060 [Pectobacterium actinidiae]|nr:hypothetical protein KKH3_16060 [Pectobacterium actinidiae]
MNKFDLNQHTLARKDMGVTAEQKKPIKKATPVRESPVNRVLTV